MTDTPPTSDAILDLVQEGWEHLRLQRPIAAWASWQRALRLAPDDPRAIEALEILASAEDLPAAARSVYKFRSPRRDEQRTAWNNAFQGRDLQDLRVAAMTFRELGDADPTDSAARYNEALCLAWQGADEHAIAALDRAVRSDAVAKTISAVEAWTLAEILRQGAGAESLADDLNHTLIVAWPNAEVDPVTLQPPGIIRRLPDPPAESNPQSIAIFEWLDRAMNADLCISADKLPRALATVIRHNRELRISSPSAWALHHVEVALDAEPAGAQHKVLSRASTPLPIRLMDSSVWTFRIPPGIDDDTRRGLAREAIEHFFEHEWIHLARQALADSDDDIATRRTPFEASRAAAAGDPVARAKLCAVVRVREQLAQRPRSAALYGGYPFDRLRRRLGLEPTDDLAFDRDDASCMSLAELRALDPNTLAEPALIDAFRSAVALDDLTAARFAKALVDRLPHAVATIDPPKLASTLVSAAWSRGDVPGAFQWLEAAAAASNEGQERDHFLRSCAELSELLRDPDAAVTSLCEYWSRQEHAAEGALEAAETLERDGHPEIARRLAAWAESRALEGEKPELAERARACRIRERREATS
jgi:hypothetical protein